MTGNEFKSDLLFQYVLSTLDDQLWFHLKLSSCELQDSKQNILGPTLPPKFKPYYLKDLQTMIISKQKQFLKAEQKPEVNATRLARILLMVGEFKLGLETLIQANQLV